MVAGRVPGQAPGPPTRGSRQRREGRARLRVWDEGRDEPLCPLSHRLVLLLALPRELSTHVMRRLDDSHVTRPPGVVNEVPIGIAGSALIVRTDLPQLERIRANEEANTLSRGRSCANRAFIVCIAALQAVNRHEVSAVGARCIARRRRHIIVSRQCLRRTGRGPCVRNVRAGGRGAPRETTAGRGPVNSGDGGPQVGGEDRRNRTIRASWCCTGAVPASAVRRKPLLTASSSNPAGHGLDRARAFRCAMGPGMPGPYVREMAGSTAAAAEGGLRATRAVAQSGEHERGARGQQGTLRPG